MDLAIQSRSLVNTFGTTFALGGVKLAARRGEAHASLTPNTARKTTTMRILLELLRKDARSAIVSRAARRPTRRRSAMGRCRSLPSKSDRLVASTEVGESPDAPSGGFLMSEFLWSRHANPWSVWTAVAAFPLLVLALYRRSRSLLGGVLLFVTLNPLLFRPPSDDRAWATRVVLGERVWLDDGVLPSREAAMAAASAPVYLATFAAARRKWRWGTLGGTVLSMTLMLRFFARMVRLYDEQAATAQAERPGSHVGPQSRVTGPTGRAGARRLR